jgi:hypothetical protein
MEGLHVEGTTFEAFRGNVADAAADLLEAGEIHVETPPSVLTLPRE